MNVNILMMVVNILMVKCNECKHEWLNAINVNILMVKCNECKHFDG